jgi:hypothetical protein
MELVEAVIALGSRGCARPGARVTDLCRDRRQQRCPSVKLQDRSRAVVLQFRFAWRDPSHDGRARRITRRRRAAGIREKHIACDQAIDVWDFGLWMSAETFNPIIEVIDGDEQHVGFSVRFGGEHTRRVSNHRSRND